MQQTIPRNGALSGMIITAMTAAVTFPLVRFDETVRAHFDRPIGDDVASLFLVGALVMGAHKLESFYAGEYDQCPVYITQSRAWGSSTARAIFLSFVTTFLGMLLVVGLALLGPPWHLAIVTVWLAHGLHELHHLGKSFARRRIYPGLFTSLLFVGVQSVLLFPAWHDLLFQERGILFTGYYAILPLLVAAFYLEDRSWIARAPRQVWDPDARGDTRLVLVARSRMKV